LACEDEKANSSGKMTGRRENLRICFIIIPILAEGNKIHKNKDGSKRKGKETLVQKLVYDLGREGMRS
jgi:hypothetical protein